MSAKVFISYSHDSPEHADRILAFSDRLRADGVDAIIDQYNPHPPEGWHHWMETKIKNADFVLMICTETYHERVVSEQEPGTGLEILREAPLIRKYIERPGTINARFVPILFGDLTADHIPGPAAGAVSYRFDTALGYEELFRLLTRQPKATKPRLGRIQAMPPRRRQTDFFPLWAVPHPRNIYFTGREDVLADLHRALKSSHAAALSQPQAVFSLGGIGKTQIAIEYAYRHQDEYTALLWVPAGSREEIFDGFLALAGLLDLPEKDEQDQGLAVKAVIAWLESHRGWLLIFDNADHRGLIEPFLPRDTRGTILLTSRARVFDVPGMAKPLEVKKMTPAEARQFLVARTGHAHVRGDEGLAVDDIIKEMDGFPLALELAGAHILRMKTTFREYLSAYTTRGLTLLKQAPPAAGKYPPSVAATLLLDFQEVEEASPASADILRASALLGPEKIPFEVLISGAEELGPVASTALSAAKESPLVFDEVLAPLAQFALIRVEPRSRTYDVHRLVQAVLKDTMDGPSRRIWSERTARAMNESLLPPEPSNRPEWERLIEHALACAELIEKEHLEFEKAARLLNQAGAYLHDRGRYDRAEALYGKALEITEKAFGPSHLKVAACLNNLAELYRTQGRYHDAEPLCKKALAIVEKALPADHPDVAASLNNLAVLYDDQGRYEEAEPLYTKALELLEKALGPDHPDVAASLDDLSGFYRAQGKYGEAEPLCKKAMDIRERVLPADHPDVATSLNNLAGLYNDQGRYGEAEPLYAKALEIVERAFGPDHPKAARVRSSLENLRKNM